MLAPTLEHYLLFAAATFAITFVVGRRDPIVPADAVARELERVREAGVTFDLVEFDGGHEIDALVLDGLTRDASAD